MTYRPRIALIGAGVRGVALLGRLIAHADGSPLTVEVWDEHAPGSGRIWRDGQSELLLMNTVAGQSTVFADDASGCSGAAVMGPDLAQWCAAVTADPDLADLPPLVRAQAATVVPHSNPSRLLYGHYLRWAFDSLRERAERAGIAVRVHATTVTSLERSAGGWRVTGANGDTVSVSSAIMALGWADRADVPRGARVISPASPIDQPLDVIPAGSTSIVRGVGMNFFDVLTLLTQGRGGTVTDGRYVPSGQEPIVHVGSRRGVPFRAKPIFHAVPPAAEQRLLRGALPDLFERRPLDFAADVLPLIEADAAWDYVATLEATRPGTVADPDAFYAALRRGDDLVAAMRAHLPADVAVLDLHEAATRLPSGPITDIDITIRDEVEADLVQARLGARSPLKMALHSYQSARSVVAPLVEFGGLTPAGRDAHRRFSEIATSFGSGPPAVRNEELLALHDAGVVRFLGPGMTVTTSEDGVSAAATHTDVVHGDYLIEAWLPAPDVRVPGTALVQSLRDAGLVRGADAHHAPSSIDVRPSDSSVIDEFGVVVPGLFSVGVPHEDLRSFTIISPIPRVPSPVLHELDAAAAAAIALTKVAA